MRRRDDAANNRFGRWVSSPDLGLTHLTFIPVIDAAESIPSTFGKCRLPAR
jgi:hypothetical protein